MSESSPAIANPLAPFAATHAEAVVEQAADAWLVKTPWGDDGVEFRLGSGDPAIGALNHLRLPPRLSAIWHRDTHDIEFIAGPTPPGSGLDTRRFSFRQGARVHLCEWAPASERLLSLARVAQPTRRAGVTDMRNLALLGFALQINKEIPEKGRKLEPWSFWIRGVTLEEQDLVSLARHLNLYMRYFDQDTPIIVVHEEPTEHLEVQPTPDPLSAFPSEIAAKDLDPHLLSLWESAAVTRDTSRRFLYHYQILEYAAFYFLRDRTLDTIKRALAAPDTPTRLPEVTRHILDTLVEDRMADEAKITAVIERYVDPKAVWNEIEPNREYFSQPVTFDGGFSLPALINANWKVEDFCGAWTPKLPDALRKIRNALVHAREARLANSILPTQRSSKRLRPWIAPLSRIAMQVMIFRE